MNIYLSVVLVLPLQVKIRSEPIGGAIKAPMTENPVSDQSFQVGRRFFCFVLCVFPPNEPHLFVYSIMWNDIPSSSVSMVTHECALNSVGRHVLGLIVTVIVNVDKLGGGCELWISIHGSKRWGSAVRMMGEAVVATWFEELS